MTDFSEYIEMTHRMTEHRDYTLQDAEGTEFCITLCVNGHFQIRFDFTETTTEFTREELSAWLSNIPGIVITSSRAI